MTHDNMWWFISWSTKRRGECPIELTGPVSEARARRAQEYAVQHSPAHRPHCIINGDQSLAHALANHGATVWLALSHWSEAALVKRKPRTLH